jgi:hypothetical protein
LLSLWAILAGWVAFAAFLAHRFYSLRKKPGFPRVGSAGHRRRMLCSILFGEKLMPGATLAGRPSCRSVVFGECGKNFNTVFPGQFTLRETL